MKSDYKDKGYGLHLDELADLEAWEGYEFWSAQLEAKMEFLADAGRVEGAQLTQLERSERQGDVLPF